MTPRTTTGPEKTGRHLASAFGALVIAAVLAAPVLPAQEARDGPAAGVVSGPVGQDRLGIALAGGGALGFAHIGVLLVLEEYGLSPEIVVGTSFGSIVGSLYAAGYSPREIQAIARTSDWNTLVFDRRGRGQQSYQERRFDRLFRARVLLDEGDVILGSGASPGQTVIELLDELLRGYGPLDSFDELPRSLAVVATDLVTGDEVIFTGGDLKSAVRASMGVPGIFDPLYYRGQFLIDGGWSNNLPVDVAIARGAERVIAVNLSLLDRSASEMRAIPVVLNQASRILRQTRINENLARADLVITPDLRGFTPADFGRAEELIERGRVAAEEKVDELIALRESVGPRVGSAWRRPVPELDRSIDIRRVEVRTPTFITAPPVDELRRRLEGQRVSMSDIQGAVYARTDLDRFRFMSYDLVSTGTTGEYDLILYPIPGPRNASEIWVGAGYRTQLLESLYSRGIIHAFGRFPFGGENRLGSRSELHAEGWLTDVGSARLSLDLPVFPGVSLQPRGYVLSSPLSFYDDRTLEALYFRRHAGGDLSLVFESPRLWHIRLGGFSEWRWTERQQGAGLLETSGEPRGGIQMDAHLDQLDRGVFPERGVDTLLRSRVWWTDPALLDSSMRTIELRHRGYLPVGDRVVLRSDLRGDTDLNSGLAREDRFYLGGVEDFPGLLFQERSGRHAVTVGGGIRAELFRLPFAIGDAGYLLLRGRIGRVWNSDIRDIWEPGTVPEIIGGGMIGVGFGTPLGEISSGVALNHDLRPVTFVLLGPTETPGGTPWQW